LPPPVRASTPTVGSFAGGSAGRRSH
jgi:hypothetical protein